MDASLARLRLVEQRQERRPGVVYQDICEHWVDLADLYAELGRAISEARRAHLLTQAVLAETLGLSRDQVALYERGARWKQDRPAIERIVRHLEELDR